MKARKILLRTLGVLFALYAVAYAVRFQTTLPIEGVVVDAKTGKPVSKVLVHIGWSFLHPGVVDARSGGFSYETFTDEAGMFRIPRKNATAVFGQFIDQTLMVKHPLYAFQHEPIYAAWDKGKEYRLGKVEGRVLRLRLPIMSLEDKYSKPEDNRQLQWELSTCGPDFYKKMRDDFGIRYDLEAIIKHIEYLATRFPENGPQRSALPLNLAEYKFRMGQFLGSY